MFMFIEEKYLWSGVIAMIDPPAVHHNVDLSYCWCFRMLHVIELCELANEPSVLRFRSSSSIHRTTHKQSKHKGLGECT